MKRLVDFRVRTVLLAVGCMLAIPLTADAGSYYYYGTLKIAPKFQYAAKFVCGINSGRDRHAASVVLPGVYATSINVHNPQSSSVRFQKKIAVTFPGVEYGYEEPGEVSKFIEDKIGPDYAFSVDCGEIPREFFRDMDCRWSEHDMLWEGDGCISSKQGPKGPGWTEGYLVIESEQSLDVTAVYTQGNLEPRFRCPEGVYCPVYMTQTPDTNSSTNFPMRFPMINGTSIDVERVPERPL